VLIAATVGCLLSSAMAQEPQGVLDGIYRHTFRNGILNGMPQYSSNTLEVAHLSAAQAFFLVHLEWANGHLCDLSGIAMVNPDSSLTYRETSNGAACELTVRATQGEVSLHDEGRQCRRLYCGSRGQFDVQFSQASHRVDSRHVIESSAQFKAALAAKPLVDPALNSK
jgi:hypothetical protein